MSTMRLHLPPVKEKSVSSLPKDRNVDEDNRSYKVKMKHFWSIEQIDFELTDKGLKDRIDLQADFELNDETDYNTTQRVKHQKNKKKSKGKKPIRNSDDEEELNINNARLVILNETVEGSETSPISEICNIIQDNENDDKYRDYDSDQYGEYKEDYY
ncbi:1370_t:CDS:2 [Funneliformis mosseae]|uniref:1370_t:CDS:1 n=1 Tax=Funneliformis mosseae TaxID=27381 RepID=A0A9N9BVX3_FUNMO|nr:1370_t:CDS:2 [Funneliformis mosseae]